MKPIKTLLLALLLAGTPVWANLGADDEDESKNADWLEGKKAVEAKDYARAVPLLSKAAAAEPKNADIQNWLGFAQRKLGNTDAAFAAYGEALKLNPKHKHAHEYVGEAYLAAGNKAKAREHLAILEKLCGKDCEEYRDLARAICR